MALNYQEFVTTVKLNSEEAKNKLEHLRKDTERWIKELLSQMQKKNLSWENYMLLSKKRNKVDGFLLLMMSVWNIKKSLKFQ